MTSSPTTRNRLLKQGTGDNTNTWGDQQSSGDFDMIDVALDGMLQLTITGPVTLSTANYVADQARNRSIKILAASSVASTITLPAVEKWALIWNASTFDQVIASQGGGTSVTVKAGECVPVVTDAVNVARMTLLTMGSQRLQNVTDPTGPQDAATKAYADALAFTANAGILPGQGGNAGKFLTTDATTASWAYAVSAGAGLASVSTNTLTVTSANASAVRTGTTTTQALTPGDYYTALAEVTITYAASVAPDMATFLNAAITLTGNLTLANPTNIKVGQSGRIRLIQDGTGSRLLSAVGSFWKRAGGLPALTTTASAYDVLVYDVVSSTIIVYDLIRNPT